MIRGLGRPALALACAALALSGAAMLLLARSRGAMWAGEWAWSMDWVNGLPLAGGPFLAGVTATVVYRFRDLGLLELVGQTRRGRWLLPALIGSALLGSLVAWALIGTGVLLMTAARSSLPVRHLEWLVLAPAALMGYAAVGTLVGRAVSRAWAAPLAFLTTFGLSYLAAGGSVPSLFRVGGSAGTLAGQTLSWQFAAWVVAVHAALAVLALTALAITAPGRRGLRQGRLALALAVVIALVVVAIAHPSPRLVFADNLAYTCAGRVVRTCMLDDTASSLPRVATVIDRYAAQLHQMGAQTPSRFVQSVPGQQVASSDGVLAFGAQDVNSAADIDSSGASLVTAPAPCPQYFGNQPPERALQAQVVLEALLRYRVDPLRFPAPDGAVQMWFDTRGTAWAVATYERMRSCDLDAIDVPAF